MALLKPYPSAEHIRAHDLDDAMGIQSPVKLKVGNAGGNDYIYPDYDASGLPNTGTAPAGPWSQAVEASDGNEYVLRSGNGYVQFHDGTSLQWGQVGVFDNTDGYVAEFVLPAAITNPITARLILVDSTGTSGLVGGDIGTAGSTRTVKNTYSHLPFSSTSTIARFLVSKTEDNSLAPAAVSLILVGGILA